MASSKQVLVLTVVAAVAWLAPLASATVYMVGDGFGWRPKFNLSGWADGKTFVVGDTLLFFYLKENHTVMQVGKDDFAACNVQGDPLAGPWTTGSDIVPLGKPGKMWFICTVPDHCDDGMKLVIDVVGATTAPAPSPIFRSPFPWWLGSAAPAPAPVLPGAAPPSAAVRYPVGGAAAVAAATAVVAAALAF